MSLLLHIAELPRSSFYYHTLRQEKVDKYAWLKQRITKIYHDHKGRYGYRRITLTLQQQGLSVNHKLVARLMKTLGLQAKIRRKKYRSYQGQAGKIADNIVQRQFTAKQPNQLWLTDVTEFKVGDKKLYLSPVLDCYNNEIVSYELSTRPAFNLVKNMLVKAIKPLTQKNKQGLVMHSDQGWHYQMGHYQQTLKDHGIVQSMSRKGNCLDNAAMESFFGTLKSETIYLNKPKSIEALEQQIHEYIKYYNNERIQLKLKGLSPVQYRNQAFAN